MTAHRSSALTQLADRITTCTRCPDLRAYCADVGRTKRKAFADQNYWARPVPGFGDPNAVFLIVGLAPAAHGANRTGRMFTGDRSGDFLYAALHRAGLANQPTATDRNDGLALRHVHISAAIRCAPPANRPKPEHLANCRPYLIEEMNLIRPRAIIALGAIGWRAALLAIEQRGEPLPSPWPKFGHPAEAQVGDVTMLGCYHVSQQNTFTGRLTEPMIDRVIRRAMAVADLT